LPNQPRAGLRQRLQRLFPYWPSRVMGRRLPRFAGVNLSALLIIAAAAYGTSLGGHWPLVVEGLKDARDAAANVSGFHVTAVAISGQRHVSRDDVLGLAGVSDRTSLLFFDAETARQKLKSNPWVADATVLKLADGLSWTLGGESGRTRTESDLTAWRAARGAAGRMPPLGFPRNNRFS